MRLTGNSIVITGAGSGIGLALGAALKDLGNIVVGVVRSEEQREHAERRGLIAERADLADASSIRALASRVLQNQPDTNILINNAGINAYEDVRAGIDEQLQTDIIVTNLLGYMRMVQAFLPQLLARQPATILNVSSDTAFVPNARTPTYCASKAGIHSYTQSLRYQLAGAGVGVIEIIPPFVQTSLLSAQQAANPHAQPLNSFIEDVLDCLRREPDSAEIVTDRARAMRHAADGGTAQYDAFYKTYNDRVTAARAA